MNVEPIVGKRKHPDITGVKGQQLLALSDLGAEMEHCYQTNGSLDWRDSRMLLQIR